MSGVIPDLRCIESVCGSCKAEIARLTIRHLCPFCQKGELQKSPSGPGDTFTCTECGAMALPGRKS